MMLGDLTTEIIIILIQNVFDLSSEHTCVTYFLAIDSTIYYSTTFSGRYVIYLSLSIRAS
jgi:hypothetical protein